MRVAIVHDYIKEYGGAERVLEALHEIFPDAPVYTLIYSPNFLGPHKKRFENFKIKTSFLQYLPFKEKLISPFRIIAPFVFKTFDFSKFDVVIISATGAYSPNSIVCHPERSEGSLDSSAKPQNDMQVKPIHICYCHTPPRYLYGFATARQWKNNLFFRVVGELANHFLRLVDYKSSQNVDFFIANSKNVRGRIKKFYKKDATVIYPPIEIPSSKSQIPNKSKAQNTKYKIQNTGYYLAGGRIARPKNIELIIKVFEKLKLPLKVFGRSFGGLNVSISKYPNIEYLGEVSDEEKLELMKNAKAFIFASEDEDFGITPVEAMSVGTPVIAYRSGGVVESVLQGRTGLFFDELTTESLSKAIKQFNNLTINASDCIAQAQKFGKERFKKEIKEFVEKVVK
ncbi:MAG: glycosyltransferase [Patescibacteria group bacterium]